MQTKQILQGLFQVQQLWIVYHPLKEKSTILKDKKIVFLPLLLFKHKKSKEFLIIFHKYKII